jgi:hypothetical protein
MHVIGVDAHKYTHTAATLEHSTPTPGAALS